MSDLGTSAPWLAAALLLVGLALALRLRLAERRVIGEVVGVERGGRLGRWATSALLVAAAAVVLTQAGEGGPQGRAPELGLLAGALLFTWLRPAAGDRVCGTTGVRHGWDLRTFAQLEEWRLLNEHLRFRLYGEWSAAPLPTSRHGEFRGVLVAVAAERESGFGHGARRPAD
jgi:hypothetical protein